MLSYWGMERQSAGALNDVHWGVAPRPWQYAHESKLRHVSDSVGSGANTTTALPCGAAKLGGFT